MASSSSKSSKSNRQRPNIEKKEEEETRIFEERGKCIKIDRKGCWCRLHFGVGWIFMEKWWELGVVIFGMEKGSLRRFVIGDSWVWKEDRARGERRRRLKSGTGLRVSRMYGKEIIGTEERGGAKKMTLESNSVNQTPIEVERSGMEEEEEEEEVEQPKGSLKSITFDNAISNDNASSNDNAIGFMVMLKT
ncbi:hypothetical protein Tco_1220448 [Tanacetum coccineum]